MARRRKARGREINGIVLLDKPKGLSSNEALQQVKGMFNAQKAGHTGSLDPLATGLLPICFGEGTKFSNYILTADKSYATECQLGVTTTTGDQEGDVVESKIVPLLTESEITEVLNTFIGHSFQIPPMYSALKQNGEPLYKLARQGIEVDREPREIWIDAITLTAYSEDKLNINVSCSKGTYIRTLVEDIGKKLGCGAHVSELRRYDLGVFHIDESVTLDKLSALRDEKEFVLMDEYIQPIETALIDLPVISLSDDAAFYIKQGQAVQIAKTPSDGLVSLFTGDDVFIGIGEIQDDGKVKPRRLLKS